MRRIVVGLCLVGLCIAPSRASAQKDTVISDPVWTRDGKRLAYERGVYPHFSIFVANADGSNPVRTVTSDSMDYMPSWSPDGKQLAFASTRDGEQSLYVIDLATSVTRRLTSGSYIADPNWSPDGRRIVYNVGRGGKVSRLHTIRPDGSDERTITDTTFDFAAAWSPDGNSILFVNRVAGHQSLMLMNPDGTNRRGLFPNPDIKFNKGYWSPDGRSIVFGAGSSYDPPPRNNPELYLMDVRTGVIKQLTNDPADDYCATWTPDGKTIAFASNRDGGKFHIWVMSSDGSSQHRLF